MPRLSGIPTSKRISNCWKKVQGRGVRYVTNNYTDRSPDIVTSMLENLKWTSLEHRRRQIRLVMLCKINKGLVDISPASFLRHSDPRTRGTQRLHQEQTQHPVLSRAFFSRTVSEWNRFPASISAASSLESFQNRLGRSPHNLQPVPISR